MSDIITTIGLDLAKTVFQIHGASIPLPYCHHNFQFDPDGSLTAENYYGSDFAIV